MRIAALVLALGIVVCGARRADACGAWEMDDTEKGLRIGYDISSAAFYKGERRVAAQYFDLGRKGALRVARDRKVVLDIAGDKVRKLGKVIGTIDGNTVKINGTTYTVYLSDAPQVNDMPTFRLVVKKGDKTIIETDGRRRCARGSISRCATSTRRPRCGGA